MYLGSIQGYSHIMMFLCIPSFIFRADLYPNKNFLKLIWHTNAYVSLTVVVRGPGIKSLSRKSGCDFVFVTFVCPLTGKSSEQRKRNHWVHRCMPKWYNARPQVAVWHHSKNRKWHLLISLYACRLDQ